MRSFRASIGPMIDRETYSFSCECVRSHWDAVKSQVAGSAGKFHSEADRKALHIADRVAAQTECDIEIIDIGQSYWTRIKYLLKGILRTPRFFVGGKSIPSVSSADQLLTQIQ
ncbi:MAG: hypothetical protein ACFE8O_06590 [Candidatus Hermodarchaeota archaeon]